MKKMGISAVALLALAACSNENTNDENEGTVNDGVEVNEENEENGEDEENEQENDPENEDEEENEAENGGNMNEEENDEAASDAGGDEMLNAEEIVEEAIALYDDLDSIYFEIEGEIDQELEAEDMPDGEIEMTTWERQWDFIEDGDFYNRLELEMRSEGEEEGEDFETEEPRSYTFTDADDPDHQISYEEGDEEAIRYEQPIEGDQEDLSAGAVQYEMLLDEADLTLDGEQEVNGFEAYRIEAETDGAVTTYWFDVETFYEVKRESEEESDAEDLDAEVGAGMGNTVVIEYELNPDFDEELFEAPDDIEVVDGTFEDTLDTGDMEDEEIDN
ncbi:hypothetical protein [Alkalicoccus chagannorensis]|uniref:hypothetical protein n=1 Tax=Alkalicoccus chagannorensis TaxID=427072 RepID=UPI00047D935B|nr:hypothetical protein [Alkalicoccus chagannorensis]